MDIKAEVTDEIGQATVDGTIAGPSTNARNAQLSANSTMARASGGTMTVDISSIHEASGSSGSANIDPRNSSSLDAASNLEIIQFYSDISSDALELSSGTEKMMDDLLKEKFPDPNIFVCVAIKSICKSNMYHSSARSSLF